MPDQTARRRSKSNPLLVLVAVIVVVTLMLMTQQALAAQVGGFIGGLWVSTVEAVLRLVAAMFGH